MLCVAVFVSHTSGILTKAEFCFFFHFQPACKKKLDPEAVDLIGVVFYYKYMSVSVLQ